MTGDSTAISIFGYDGTIRYASQALANLLGYLPEEITGKTFRRFVNRTHIRQTTHAWAQLIAPGASGGETYVQLTTRDGDIIPVTMEVSPIPGRDEFIVVYKGVARGRDQLAALSTTLTALGGTLKLSQVLDVILDQLTRVVPGDHCAVLLLRDGRLRPVRHRGDIPVDTMNVPGGDWLNMHNIQRVYETLRPCIINDTRTDPHWIQLEGVIVRSWIGIPLLYKGQFLGVLEAATYRANAYTIADASAAQLFGQQAASAIRHAQLYRAIRSRAARLKALNDIGLALSRLELNDVIRTVYESVAAIMDVDVFYVALYDPKAERLRLRHIKNRDEWLPDNDEAPLTGLVGYVIRRREVLLIGDTRRDGYPVPALRFDREEDTRNVVIIPLIAQDKVIGALSVQSFQPDSIKPPDVKMLEAIASQTAVAIRNAQLYDTLAEANRELEAQERLQNELVQNLSHEMRNPLSFVKGYTNLLLDGGLGPITPEQAEALNVIDQKSETITRFVADLMTLETLDAKGLQLARLDLNTLAAQAITGAKLARKDSNLRFEFSGTDAPLPIIGDADRLNQVLDNLIGNAAKFSPDGGCITVHTGKTGDRCLVSVADTGIGIPKDKLPHIFDRFYQVDTSLNRRFKGVGLGLAIVQRIIESHNGMVNVESEIGKGSTFIVSLPEAGTTNALKEAGEF